MKKFLLTLIFITFFQISFASDEIEKVVILGSGPAGLTSAILTGQASLNPLVVEGPKCLGQLEIIHKIDNYPGFPEEIGGDELLKKFREQALKFGTHFENSSNVVEINLEQRPFQILFEDGKVVYAEALIIAQGVTKRWLGLESEQLLRGKGVMGTSVCQKEKYQDKIVTVVGGGHAALQEALLISEFASKVYLINRSDKFNASVYHQNLAFANSKIEIIYNSDVEEIQDLAQDHVTSVSVRNLKTDQMQNFATDGVVIAIGSTPNTDIFKGKLELTASGHIALKGKNMSTSVEGVFAAGDASEMSYGRVIVASGTGGMAALDAIKFLSAK